ncbi:hypothetical protein Godav_010262 [Gossypium davidsonii]|uniref:Uncharacterized protein n=1 Tax=Gossypium davidsonii TaxID=34287 RepID=A0A7J8SGJ3_GOSDV|nr:hypothetical protein [Gossypium davidsonii]
MIGVRPKSSQLALRPNNGKFGVKVIAGHGVFDDGSKLRLMGRPSDEMMGNHLHDSIELKSVMKGLVCELERTREKTLMDDSQIVVDCMVVEDAWNDE